ncbi:HNH/ENDO VII family nuclease [Mycolicibacterium komossense]|uniref:HNH/ENDO VII family nuclease n=1 Tax=Mycolicibacterium komossense TaxID=1779 RepID=A0ABT3CHW7_9MYCO|nr:HNH/ENDO VII family nuclease [Mycolicibacterium komossense]MCV7229093.1 HNH/ENDO VII family nuclease [Mycolicibacterium komossense]
MTMTIADIERWSAESVREVFHAGQTRAEVTNDVSRELSTLQVFNSWDGEAAKAAQHAIAKTRQDLDAHGREAQAVAAAANLAANDIERVQQDLKTLQADAELHGLEIDPATNRIVPTPHSTHGRREMQEAIPGLQARLDTLIADANAVDAELAAAINMADGDMPIPPTPDGIAGPGDKPMSDADIKATVDNILEGQDLSPTERARLAQQLTDQLHQSALSGMTADQASEAAENQATAYMASLHRPYVRVKTRLGVYRDALRNTDGDILSDVSDAVIPARRNANGDLIWVDRDTGRVVGTGPEGPPNSMTVPEKGASHLGHEYGDENWRVLRQAEEEGWTQEELNDFMNNREKYRLETPAENSGHANEDKSPYESNPDWTPERVKAGQPAGGSATSAGTGSYSPPSNGPVINVTPEQVAQGGAITVGGVIIGVLTFLENPWQAITGGG